jgi:hypothetical protein
MIPYLDALPLKSRLVVLHRRPKGTGKWFGPDLVQCPPSDPKVPDILVVDGAEQLSGWQRRRLIRNCQQRGIGLLVTSHRSLGLPALVNTRVTRDLARQIVRELLLTWPPTQSWSETQLQSWLDRTDPLVNRYEGNLRELLFTLYDQFQQGTRQDVGMKAGGLLTAHK